MPPKKRRRPRGEGGFYKRKADGLWIGAVSYEDEYGQPRRATVSSRDKQLAMEKFRALRTKIENGTYRPRSKMTVEQWLTYWIENMVRPTLKPKTARSYADTCKNQIIPLIGDKRLPLTPAQVRGLLRQVGDTDGWGERTVQITYVVLNIAMKAAVKEEVIDKNPCEVVAKPKVTESSSEKALTSTQARRVLLAAKKAGDPYVTRWAAAFLLGARQGELLGLERDRVDVKNMTVELSWQLQTLETHPGASLTDPNRFIIPDGFEVRPLYRRFALTRPKTERSKRLTPLPVPLAAILDEYLKTAETNEFGLVWVTPKGNPIPQKYDSDAWHAALERAKVPDLPQHAARHTTATLLQEMGVEESVRMQIMGHSTVAAQRAYAHVDLAQARKALGNLDGLLNLSS
ncbi:tyrosine-type recombinase/integrase [Nocardia cyriacigeorgica]|uniref:tyrosine-type recombinase/integrase n=1 Tax=Nocardia cyriacigeorgica TaxID=135487 RepID=UPI0024587979|nr:tyrosine-type recombinase/integrase [Nocardia cyriacigeorgica]